MNLFKFLPIFYIVVYLLMIILTAKLLSRNKKIIPDALKIFLIILIVYLFSSDCIRNPMQSSILSLTESLSEEFTIIVDNHIFSREDLSFNRGHFYSGVPVGLSFLAIPVFLISKITFGVWNDIFLLILANSTTSFIVALSLVFLFLLLRDFGSTINEAKSLTFLCAFGTLFYVYGSAFSSRVIAASLIIIALYLIEKYKTISNRLKNCFPLPVGFLLGIMVAFNYASIILSLIFIVYLIFVILNKGNNTINSLFYSYISIFLGFLIPLSFILVYHHFAFGSIFNTPYDFRYKLSQQLFHADGIAGFTYPKIDVLIQLLFIPYKGLFFYMPIYLFSFVGLFYAINKRKVQLILSGLCMVLFILFNSGLNHWTGEWCFGPRLLLESVPFAILLAAPIINKNKKFYYLIFLYSFLINFIGLSFRYVGPYYKSTLSLARYFLDFAKNGLRFPLFYKLISDLNYIIQVAINYFVFTFILVIISLVINNFDFKLFFSNILESFKNIRAIDLVRIICISVVFSSLMVFVNAVYVINEIPLSILLIKSNINSFLFVFILFAFKNTLFDYMISVDDEKL